MNILTKITLGASLLPIGLGMTFASTTDELQITSGGYSAIISDSSSFSTLDQTCTGNACFNPATDVGLAGGIVGDSSDSAGTTTASGDINGWVVKITSGTSASPSDVPVGLDVSSFTATCSGSLGAGCSMDPLDIQFSDINFNPANPAFVTGYSLTSLTGTGSTSESAYYSNSNAVFAETTLIGTVGPLTGVTGGTASGGVGSTAPYSLTLDQVFEADGSGASVAYSVDGSISSVPEPAAVMLFGTVLALCATRLRRMRRNGVPEADNK
jgi:hypothetical protein